MGSPCLGGAWSCAWPYRLLSPHLPRRSLGTSSPRVLGKQPRPSVHGPPFLQGLEGLSAAPRPLPSSHTVTRPGPGKSDQLGCGRALSMRWEAARLHLGSTACWWPAVHPRSALWPAACTEPATAPRTFPPARPAGAGELWGLGAGSGLGRRGSVGVSGRERPGPGRGASWSGQPAPAAEAGQLSRPQPRPLQLPLLLSWPTAESGVSPQPCTGLSSLLCPSLQGC